MADTTIEYTHDELIDELSEIIRELDNRTLADLAVQLSYKEVVCIIDEDIFIVIK